MTAKNEIRIYTIVDASGAKTGVSFTQKEFDKLAASAEKTATTIQSKFSSVFTSQFGKASGAVGNLASSVGGMAVPLAAAGGLIAKFALDGAAQFGALGEQVEKFKTISGTSADTASRWVKVADDFGVSADELAVGFSKLGKALGTNVHALDEYGVSVKRTKDGSVDMNATALNVIDTYNKTVDPTIKAKLATEAFGKSYTSLIPLIDEGSAKILDRFQQVDGAQLFTDKKLDEAKKYRLAMDDLHDAVSDLQMEMGEVLIPTIDGFAKALDRQGPGIAKAIAGINDLAKAQVGFLEGAVQASPVGIAWGMINDVAPSTKANVDDVTAATLLAGRAAREAAGWTGDYAGTVAAATDVEYAYVSGLERRGFAQVKATEATQKDLDVSDYLIKSYQGQLAAIDKLRKGIDDQTAAALNANDAHLAAVSADERVTEAMAKYNETLAGTPPNLAAVARAQDELTAAKQRYQDTLKVTPSSGLDIAKADVALKEAQQKYADTYRTHQASPLEQEKAKIAVTEAEDKYQKVLADGTSTALDREKALVDLEDAQEKYRKTQEVSTATDLERQKALNDQTQAQEDYDAAVKGSTSTADEQAAALADVQQKQKEYDDANKVTVASEHDKKQAFLDVQQAINDAAAAHATEKQTLMDEAGLSYGVRDALDTQITSLENVEKTVKAGSPLYNALAAHIQQLRDARDAADEATDALNIYNGVPGGGAAGYYDPKTGTTGPHHSFATGTNRVPGLTGAPMLAVVHGGEKITPAAMAGGSNWSQGQTVIVNQYFTVAAATDKVAVGRALEDARKAYLQAGGRAAA